MLLFIFGMTMINLIQVSQIQSQGEQYLHSIENLIISKRRYRSINCAELGDCLGCLVLGSGMYVSLEAIIQLSNLVT